MENSFNLPERNPDFNVYGKACSSFPQIPTEKEFLVYNQNGTVHYLKDLANRALPVLVKIQNAAIPALAFSYIGYVAGSLAPRAFSLIAASASTVHTLGGILLVCIAVHWILNDWLEKTKANYNLYLTTEMNKNITENLPRAMAFATKMTQERAQKIGKIENNAETQKYIIPQIDFYLEQGLLDDALQCIYRITDEGERNKRLKRIAPIYHEDNILITEINQLILAEERKPVRSRDFLSLKSTVLKIQNATKRDAYLIKILKTTFYPALHQDNSPESLKRAYSSAAAFTDHIQSQQKREYALLDIARQLLERARYHWIAPRDILNFLFEIDSLFNDQDPRSPLISDADLEGVIDSFLLLPGCGVDCGVDAIMLLCDPAKKVAKLEQLARRFSSHPRSAVILRMAHACMPKEEDTPSAELMNAYKQERLLAYLIYQEKTKPSLKNLNLALCFDQILYKYDSGPGERELDLIGQRIQQPTLQSRGNQIVTEFDKHYIRLKRYYDYINALPLPTKRVRFSEEVQHSFAMGRACLLVPAA